MTELVLTELNKELIDQLQQRAVRHGRTPADEATALLSNEFHGTPKTT